jgi:predicted nucleic acid-binding protein
VRANSFAPMTKPIAYIETTVPNFYYDLRSSAAVTTRRAWTRQWWDSARDNYDLVTSEEVWMELSAGTSHLVPLRLALLDTLPMLPFTPEVIDTANTYIRRKLMPGRPSGDAFHLALASHYKCDFIVTWNCKHLANPNKFAHVRHLNQLLGLPVPEIVTPQNLLRRT